MGSQEIISTNVAFALGVTLRLSSWLVHSPTLGFCIFGPIEYGHRQIRSRIHFLLQDRRLHPAHATDMHTCISILQTKKATDHAGIGVERPPLFEMLQEDWNAMSLVEKQPMQSLFQASA